MSADPMPKTSRGLDLGADAALFTNPSLLPGEAMVQIALACAQEPSDRLALGDAQRAAALAARLVRKPTFSRWFGWLLRRRGSEVA